MQRYDTDHLNRIQFKQSYFRRCHASFECPHRYITNKYLISEQNLKNIPITFLATIFQLLPGHDRPTLRLARPRAIRLQVGLS